MKLNCKWSVELFLINCCRKNREFVSLSVYPNLDPCNWFLASKSVVRDERFAIDGDMTPVRLFSVRLKYVSFTGNMMKGGIVPERLLRRRCISVMVELLKRDGGITPSILLFSMER